MPSLSSAARAAARIGFALTAFFAPAVLRANCGSATCPIDPQSMNLPGARQFTLDLSFQYIDQDRPRIGTRAARIGEIPSTHDEVRTVNRVGTLFVNYAPTDRLILALSAPWVSRFHEHVEEETGSTERWRLDAAGDISLSGRYTVGGSLWVSSAIKLPTGRRRPANAEGEIAEVTIAPGTGSIDVSVGAGYQSQMTVPSLSPGVLGNAAAMPIFAGVTYRVNGSGTNRYRHGNELQANAGVFYPVLRSVQAILQVNARVKAKDGVGDTDEDRDHTGGSFVYASPGIRVSLPRGLAVYGIVQLPLYQRVNGIQLTARYNLLAGVQARF